MSPALSISLLALVLFILAFSGVHFLGAYFLRALGNHKGQEPPSLFLAHICRRLLGFTLMGILPLLVFYYVYELPLGDYGINMYRWERSFIWILLLLPPIIAMNYYIAGKPSNLSQYPQIRLIHWDLKNLLVNFTSWILYLLGYEMLFRGFLLFALYDAFGLTPAIAMNVVLYALAHIPKGLREMAGSVPFGIILCMITLNTGSFLAAFVLHSAMALSNEFFAIRFHPNMRIKSLRP